MNSPEGMNFQYFFFNTYTGYFLQALPFALIAGIVCWVITRRRHPDMPKDRLIWRVLFVCYLTGLVCLTLALYFISSLWYRLLYHSPDGRAIRMFEWDYNFIPYFFTRLNSEIIGNITLFMPFGILYPLSKPGVTWKRSLLSAFLCILGIEILQPVFGRAFDVNDICLNMIGVGVSTLLFFVCAKALRNRKKTRQAVGSDYPDVR